MIEPGINFVANSYKTNFGDLPNEDSNNAELTANNLFVGNRVAGSDRNEAGQRTSYGVRSSFFNKYYGQFGLVLGQSLRITNPIQDVQIRGFNENNKSNIVGETSYKTKKHFSITYSFQLNESNYRNDVNTVSTSLTFDRFSISNNYILIRKTTQNNNPEIEQTSISSNMKLTSKLSLSVTAAKDLIYNRVVSRSANLIYDGCCVIFNFSATENNSLALTRPEKSYKINISIKGL
jgi:LPS-assembly protein